MLLVMAAIKTLQKNKYVQAVMRGLKPCIIGIIFATGVYMTIKNCFTFAESASVNIRATIIAVILITIMFGVKIIVKKKVSSIMFIVISACLGIVIYGI